MRGRPRTLRARLTLGTTVLVLGVLAVVGVSVYYSTSSRLSAALRSSLRTITAQAMAGANYQNGRLTLGPAPDEPANTDEPALHGYGLTIVRPDGSVLRQVGPLALLRPPAHALRAALRGNASLETVRDPAGGKRLLVLSTPLRENGTTIAVYGVSLSQEPMFAALDQLRLTLLVLLPLAAAVAAFLGFLLVGRMLGPLARVTSTARQISSRDFSRRHDLPRGDDEVGSLAAAFDAMLERLEDSFHRERQFVADASHELRTPLAALQAIVSVTRSRPRGRAAYEAALDDIDAEAARLRALTESLLELARGDDTLAGSTQCVDVSGLLESVCASLRPLAQAKGLSLDTGVASGLVVSGDEDALVRVLVNVVDNAIKYTGQGGIVVEAERTGDTVRVRVHDTGIGLTPEDAAHAFDRFYRGDASRSSSGAGLGLSLARQIVDAHDGSITLSASAAGATCSIALPAAVQTDTA